MALPTQDNKLLDDAQPDTRQTIFMLKKIYLHWVYEYVLYHIPTLNQGKVANHAKEQIALRVGNFGHTDDSARFTFFQVVVVQPLSYESFEI